jgi:endonuclease/exonuclease/phosphatase family metal-dependent hydrolase
MTTGFFRKFTKRILILCNIIVAIFLLISCYGNRLDGSDFWYSGLFSLASFYLLLALVTFFFFWLFVKPVGTLISIIAVLLCWQPLNNLLQLRLTPNFVMAKHPANLRVMSWNVEHFDILEFKTHPERKLNMISMIREYQPDVACFQEMVGSYSEKSAINYIPDFASGFSMENYHYSFNPKLDFDNNHHFGIIIFSKYPIINKHTISYAPNDYNSIFQYVDIVKGNDTFRIFNAHLQSLKFSNSNLRYIEKPSLNDERDIQKSRNVLQKLKQGFLKRKEQSDRIRKQMEASPYPVVICGDFNDVPNSYAYRTIGKGMNDAFTEKGTGIGRTYSGVSPTLRIDHIFADKRFNIEQYIRVRKKISDHFPLIADLFFSKENH